MKYYKYLILFLGLVLFSDAQSQKDTQTPLSENPTQFRQYVVDETGTLTPTQVSSLNTKLINEDRQTTNQIIVYMISSLHDESLEDVSMRLAEKNKIGKKDRNNGVLLFVVKDDRKLRIEVGYGLEGALTDAVTSQIIRKDVTPSFKNGNFYEGINKGVDAIISVTKGEYTAEKESQQGPGGGTGCCFGMPLFVVAIFGFIFFFMLISFIKRIFGFGKSIYTGGRGWNSGWGGGFGGGGWGGGSSGGGGFSGGGGSFGGGGASGSW